MKSKNLEYKKFAIVILLLLSISIIITTLAFAIPNSLSIQGKLTNQAGSSQQGTFNFTFKIYDNMTAGNILWELVDYNITTDANGVYDVILNKINVSFAEQLYLGIAVGSDNESTPRINLTSAPYSFRANTSEALNPNASYFVTNLSVSGHATIGNGSTSLLEISSTSFNLTTSGNIKLASNLTVGDQIFFRFGQIIDNLVNGFLRINGNLNVTGNTSIAQNTLFVDNTSSKVGIGTTSPGSKLTVVGGINATGGLNVTAGNVLLATTSGSVGIGTATPSKILTVNGTTNAITLDPSAAPNPVINTTGNNITITSASGSIIIRLG